MDFVQLLIERLQLKDFVKAQDKGLQTVIYSEGRQLPYTVSKKIMIARALASKPKLLVLKDPTEDFLDQEESKVIDFITDPNMPWAVVIVSRSDKWKSKCNRFFFMDNGVMSTKE